MDDNWDNASYLTANDQDLDNIPSSASEQSNITIKEEISEEESSSSDTVVKQEPFEEGLLFYYGGLANGMKKEEVTFINDGSLHNEVDSTEENILGDPLSNGIDTNSEEITCEPSSIYGSINNEEDSIEREEHILSNSFGDLRTHMMSLHTGEKPHQCPHCEYRSVKTGPLKNHIFTHHTGEKPHQCPHCDHRTVQASNLKRHIKASHAE